MSCNRGRNIYIASMCIASKHAYVCVLKRELMLLALFGLSSGGVPRASIGSSKEPSRTQ